MTELTSPTWDAAGDGLRVLVEAADWATRHHMARALEAAGHEVASCPGPSGADARCPLATGQGCAGAEGADVVVFALHPGDHRNRECLRAHRTKHPGTPVVIDVPEAAMRRNPGDYAGCLLVQEPGSAESLVAAVERASH